MKTFESQTQAAGVLGEPLELIRAAKAAGCPAFLAGGRIRHAPLKEWLRVHRREIVATLAKGTLKDKLIAQQIRRLLLENDRREGKLVERGHVVEAIQACGTAVKGILRQRLESEWPSQLAGCTVAEARVMGKQLGDSILREFQALADLWPQ